jgi:uncharacterized protein involved in outer membrane biogenesis
MAGEAQRTSPRRWIWLTAAVLPVVAFVLPPLVNVNRFQHRIADSISRSIGRQVHISSVKLQLLPLPGVQFSGFSVEENPQFGAEPILHSDSVVAYLRLSSLWRGRMEVARIHFDDASLNLVQDANGEWNFASVLVQAAHIPNAPTGQRRAGSAPRFPYIEAENARVNFKEGTEKKPLSFLNADLSVSLAAGDDWELHFRAQPVRTDLDLHLADTGVLRIDGILHRAAVLGEMPLKLNVQWSAAPLGELSRLTLGSDIGWRGGLNVEGEVSGTAKLAQINTRLRIAGLHRSEYSSTHPIDVETSCRALFRKKTSSLEEIACSSPVGDGRLTLTGAIDQVQTDPVAQLTLAIHRVPAAAVLSGLQEVHSGLGNGVQAAGALDGHFAYVSQSGRSPSVSGEMAIESLSLTPPDGNTPFLLGPVKLRCETPQTGDAATRSPELLLQPVRLAMGAPVPVMVDGRFTPAGYDLHLRGATSLARLQAFTRAFGWLGTRGRTPANGQAGVLLGGTGTASLDLGVRGKWLQPIADSDHPAPASTAEGSISLRNAELTTPYLSQPLKIVAAQGLLGPAQITWANATVSYGGLSGVGTLEYPSWCAPQTPCGGRFSVALPALDLAALQSTLLGTSQRGEFLRELLDRIGRHGAAWPDLAGTMQIGALSTGKLVVHDATAALSISGQSITVRSLNGRLAGGTMHLTGAVDATGDQPAYRVDVQVTHAAPSDLAGIFDERWGGGLVNLSAQMKMAGFAADDLARSATGVVHWDWTRGGLAAEDSLPPAAMAFAHFDQWSADATVDDQTIKITHSLLTQGEDALPVTGTIAFSREVDLKGGSAAHGFAVTGTLEHPEVKATTEEVAN